MSQARDRRLPLAPGAGCGRKRWGKCYVTRRPAGAVLMINPECSPPTSWKLRLVMYAGLPHDVKVLSMAGRGHGDGTDAV